MPFVYPGDSVGGLIPAGGRGIGGGGFVFPQNVVPMPPFVSAGTINGTVGTTLTFQIFATGAPFVPNGFTVTPALPAGLTLNQNTGQITGTPTTVQAAQTYQMTAENSVGVSMPANLTITIAAALQAPVVTPGQSISGSIGTAITPFTIATTGGAPTSFAVTPALPTGLTLNTTTGQVTGTPGANTSTGSPYTVNVTATNAAGTSPAVALTVTIADPALLAPVVTAGQSINSTVGLAITTFQIATTGGAPTSFAVTPALPTGLTLNTTTGQITGTPGANTSTASPYTVNVTATNATGTSPAVAMTVNVHSGAPAITSPNTATANEGTLFTYTITASGHPAPTLGATGLPAWLSFTAPNTVSGTPPAGSAPGTATFTATATNGVLPDASQVVTVTIAAGWELTYAFPAQPTMTNLTARIPLPNWTGYAAHQTEVVAMMTDALYDVTSQALMPVKMFARFGLQPELEIPFDNWTNPPGSGSHLREWGWHAGSNSVYIMGANGTGQPVQLRLVHE